MEPNPYTPKKLTPLRLIAMAFRSLAGLLGNWPLLALIAVLASPVGPHVLVTYQYRTTNGHTYKTHCEYLGSRGWVGVAPYSGCPFITILDTRQGYR